MESKDLMFGQTSPDDFLMKAQGVISDVLHFIVENKDSDDKEKKDAARAAMALVCLDNLMKSQVIKALAKDIAENIESEHRGGGRILIVSREAYLFRSQPARNRRLAA